MTVVVHCLFDNRELSRANLRINGFQSWKRSIECTVGAEIDVATTSQQIPFFSELRALVIRPLKRQRDSSTKHFFSALYSYRAGSYGQQIGFEHAPYSYQLKLLGRASQCRGRNVVVLNGFEKYSFGRPLSTISPPAKSSRSCQCIRRPCSSLPDWNTVRGQHPVWQILVACRVRLNAGFMSWLYDPCVDSCVVGTRPASYLICTSSMGSSYMIYPFATPLSLLFGRNQGRNWPVSLVSIV